MSRFGEMISIRIRRRALNVLRERLEPLIRVEPRINSSLEEEFIRFLYARISRAGRHHGGLMLAWKDVRDDIRRATRTRNAEAFRVC